MIEKKSEDIRCKICGKPATCEVAGIPCCADCADSEEIKSHKEIIQSFED